MTKSPASRFCVFCLFLVFLVLTFVDAAHIDYVDFCHDSAKQVNLMALATPSVRPSENKFLWCSLNRSVPGVPHKSMPLGCKNRSLYKYICRASKRMVKFKEF